MIKPRLVVIGGGTGSFTLLRELKKVTPHISALVNMVDDGGSTGVLRDELGVLPPGDVRQCLVALSNAPTTLRELFNYRFPAESSFAGHSFGNLFLGAVENMGKDFGEAVELAGAVLNITGHVVPVTLQNCHLVAEVDGQRVTGQYNFEQFETGSSKPKLWLEPAAKANPTAVAAIREADLVIIAPGNLYSSLIPTVLVTGIAKALTESSAKVVYVCNLVNKPHQASDFMVHDYVAELERFAGRGTIDYVLYNVDQPSPQQLEAYALDGELPVAYDQTILKDAPYTALPGHFLAHGEPNLNERFISRSLIRHNAVAVRKMIEGLL